MAQKYFERFLISFVIINLLYCKPIYSVCPKPDLIVPCTCTDDAILCGGNIDIDLVKLFKSLSNSVAEEEKHFRELTLSNTVIEDLKQNTFKDITFDVLNIWNMTNLKEIHRNTFTATNLVTKHISIYGNPKLHNEDNSLYEALSKFVNVEVIDLSYNKIHEIPEDGLLPRNGYQDKLKTLIFRGKEFSEVDRHAFYYLNNIQNLRITETSIGEIEENAFAFEERNDNPLNLTLHSNPGLQSSQFKDNSLFNLKRPTTINFGSTVATNQITYLDEKVFLPFLVNRENRIDLLNQQFDCNDCRNRWLTNQVQLLPQILNLRCSNGNDIRNYNNFNMFRCRSRLPVS